MLLANVGVRVSSRPQVQRVREMAFAAPLGAQTRDVIMLCSQGAREWSPSSVGRWPWLSLQNGSFTLRDDLCSREPDGSARFLGTNDGCSLAWAILFLSLIPACAAGAGDPM